MAKLKPGAITVDLETGGIYGDLAHCPLADLLESAEAVFSLLPRVRHKGIWALAKDFDAQCYVYTKGKSFVAPEDVHLEQDIYRGPTGSETPRWAKPFTLLVQPHCVRDAYWRAGWYEPLIGSFRDGKVSAETEGIVDLTAEARAEMEQHRREIEEREASKPRQLKMEF
ncbi:MAG: hypothetical protein E3J65_02090 [Dehalococcoidia bacterium]|nr:MAG: hypothetical protein E3J65_02090 [Dehalococcoidia bacterium]